LAAGFICSVILHGLILLVFLSAHDRTIRSPNIPMDAVVLADETASPPQSMTALAPQQQAGMPSSPAARRAMAPRA
jgi:hypothetical protein